MVKERRHDPLAIFVWTVLCALGLAALALGIADGWVLVASGVAALSVSLVRLHVLLQRRRAAVGMTPLPLSRAPVPTDRRSRQDESPGVGIRRAGEFHRCGERFRYETRQRREPSRRQTSGRTALLGSQACAHETPSRDLARR